MILAADIHDDASAGPINVLFASSEVWPLAQTGGLADVAYNLPKALGQLGLSVGIIMPGYRDAIKRAGETREIAHFNMRGRSIKLLEARLPHCNIPLWLVADPLFSERSGSPYQSADDQDWPDNAQRFDLFCSVVSHLAVDADTLGWQPDIVHCNDWQTGLIPVYLKQYPQRPTTVFTVHNLAYQGLFSHATFVQLGLDSSLWQFDALEFYGQLSFIKGGLSFADAINTVSPTYAEEITTKKFGCGLSELFQYRRGNVIGIINGIDTVIWNPAKDHYLAQNYSPEETQAKRKNKIALQRRFKLPHKTNATLIGWVGRLVEQKGIDQVIEAMPQLLALPIQLIVLGSGSQEYVDAIKHLQELYPEQLVFIDSYDEALAHQIVAGADCFLMPSRFEPCGLTQLYSLRYGTLPIANQVGGLADTLVDCNPQTLADGTANSILCPINNTHELIAAVERALAVIDDPATHRKLMRTGMQQDYSWANSAKKYAELYGKLLSEKQENLSHSQNISHWR